MEENSKLYLITNHYFDYNFKDPSSRLFRWRLKIEDYDFIVEYKSGKINANADLKKI